MEKIDPTSQIKITKCAKMADLPFSVDDIGQLEAGDDHVGVGQLGRVELHLHRARHPPRVNGRRPS